MWCPYRRSPTPTPLPSSLQFGKGTSSLDGVALLAATLRHLLRGASAPPQSSSPSFGGSHNESAPGTAGSLQLASGGFPHPPKTVITTHFREIFDYGLLSNSLNGSSSSVQPDTAASSSSPQSSSVPPRHVTFFHMSVHFDKKRPTTGAVAVTSTGMLGDAGGAAAGSSSSSSSGDGTAGGGAGGGGEEWEDTVVPMFRLEVGVATSSYGLACAAKGGVPHHVIARAKSVTDSLKQHRPIARLSSYRYPGLGSTRLATAAAWPTTATGLRVGGTTAALALADLMMTTSSWTPKPLEETLDGDDHPAELTVDDQLRQRLSNLVAFLRAV